MGNIQCTKCGLDAFGKCPKCRSVFTEKYEYQMADEEKECEHDWHYKVSEEKCIYGCGYKRPLIYAGQF